MKKLQNLKGAKALNKKEQQSVNGGGSGWCGHCFPSEEKCNHYCTRDCFPCGVPSNGFIPHVCECNQ